MQKRHGFRSPGWHCAALLLSLALWSPTSAQIAVTTIAAPVNTLTISDLDYLNATTPKWLFTITMTAPGTVEAVMTINLDVQLAAGATYINAAQFTSKPFTINGTRTVTNLELGKQPPGIPQREVDGYVFNAQAKAAFQDIALPSGSMPAGSYRFSVSVKEVQGGSGGTDDFTFVLTNPSSPVLIAPAEGETIVEEFPLFEWQYDGPRSTIVIYEQLPGQQSLEETASGTPHFTETVAARSLRYPVMGARALKPGKTYIWYVAGLVGAAGGTNNELRSPLRSFNVSTSRSTSLSWLLQELESALPPSWKPVFDQIRAQNFSPSGTIRLNGTTISVGDFLKVLSDFRTNPEAISSVNFE
ncbi:MAG: hypothetical protein HY961_17330 [Ignavibacteriae bacterium]|nr:hypothetical protein [Ignavibacteriota bacterium]